MRHSRNPLVFLGLALMLTVAACGRGGGSDSAPEPGDRAVVIGSVMVALAFALAAFVVAWTGNRLRALALSQASSKASSAG